MIMLNTCTPLERLYTSSSDFPPPVHRWQSNAGGKCLWVCGFPWGGGRRLQLRIDWRITRLNKRELSYHDLKQDFPFVISCYVWILDQFKFSSKLMRTRKGNALVWGRGGGYSCLPVKRDGRVGFQNKCIFYFHFYLLQVHWHLIFLSFLMITELYLFKRHWIYRYITICTYFQWCP